jgi:hypothetical protein
VEVVEVVEDGPSPRSRGGTGEAGSAPHCPSYRGTR